MFYHYHHFEWMFIKRKYEKTGQQKTQLVKN